MTQQCARTNPTNAIVKNASGRPALFRLDTVGFFPGADQRGSRWECLDLRQEEFDTFSAELCSGEELGGSESEYERSVLQSQL